MSPIPGGFIPPPFLEPLRNNQNVLLPSTGISLTGFAPDIDDGEGTSFTTSPIRFLDTEMFLNSPAGNNRRFGVSWNTTNGSADGQMRYGDSFTPAYFNFASPDQPQYHEDALTGPTQSGPDRTQNFEIAVLEVLQTPGDLPAQWFSTLQPPVIGQYFTIGTTPTFILSTLASDGVGFIRIFEMVFSIRRISDSQLMAEAIIKLTVERT